MFCDHRAFMSAESSFKVSSAVSKPRYIPLTIATLSTKGMFSISSFQFESAPFSDGQRSKVSARPTVFNCEHLKVVQQYRPTNKSLEFAILPAAQDSKRLY